MSVAQTISRSTHIARQRTAQDYVYASLVTPANSGRPCRKCRHFANVFRPRCNHGDFPVTKNATCSLWVAP